MTMLCPCGCGLAAENAEGAPRRGHEAAAKALALAEHRYLARHFLANGPKRNGTLNRRARARARKEAREGQG
jgi:hypothetical protein